MPALDNPQHESFAQALARGETADEAYRSAGFRPHRSNAARLKGRPEVATRVREIVEAGAVIAEVSTAKVLEELGRLGFSDIRRVFSATGGLLAPADWPADVAASVASVEVVTRTVPGPGDEAEVEYVSKLKLWDKNSALDKIARHLGMFVERIEAKHAHTVDDSVAGLMVRIATHGKRLVPITAGVPDASEEAPSDE